MSRQGNKVEDWHRLQSQAFHFHCSVLSFAFSPYPLLLSNSCYVNSKSQIPVLVILTVYLAYTKKYPTNLIWKVSLLSMCLMAKNKQPVVVIWSPGKTLGGHPDLVMQDVRSGKVVYWISLGGRIVSAEQQQRQVLCLSFAHVGSHIIQRFQNRFKKQICFNLG